MSMKMIKVNRFHKVAPTSTCSHACTHVIMSKYSAGFYPLGVGSGKAKRRLRSAGLDLQRVALQQTLFWPLTGKMNSSKLSKVLGGLYHKWAGPPLRLGSCALWLCTLPPPAPQGSHESILVVPFSPPLHPEFRLLHPWGAGKPLHT